MKSQEDQILEALKAHPEGLHPTYFIMDLYVYQYNRAIHNLRKLLGCECKNGYKCSSQEHIVNRTLKGGKTKFFYEKVGQDVDWNKMKEEDKKVINSQDKLF